MTENRIFTLWRMITWVVFLRMFWNFISSLPVKRGGSLSFLNIFTFAVPELLDLLIFYVVFFVLFVFILCLVSNVTCVFGLSILDCPSIFLIVYLQITNGWFHLVVKNLVHKREFYFSRQMIFVGSEKNNSQYVKLKKKFVKNFKFKM
jgi:hypothetical protein